MHQIHSRISVYSAKHDPPIYNDLVAEEVAIAFEYNGLSQAVMLATPSCLEDLAWGFSLTEGIVEHESKIRGVDIAVDAVGITLQIELASSSFAALKQRRRTLLGRTGCGLCGVDSLNSVSRELCAVPTIHKPFPLAALHEGLRRLPEKQRLQQLTGAAHAACAVDYNGDIYKLREDVGRHNALDKTLGALARSSVSASDMTTTSALIVTSRASFEMVQKAAARQVAVLAAVSAPTMAAVRLADKLNMCLVGFLHNNSCVIYTNPEYLKGYSSNG